MPVYDITATPPSAMIFRGGWSALGGTFPPTPTAPETLDYYRIIDDGTMTGAQGSITANAGDYLHWDMALDQWFKVDATDSVLSVNSKAGAVVLTKSDVGLSLVPNVDATNASNISTGTISDARLPASITSDITGNAATATTATSAAKLTTARAITLTGDVTGTTTFDGSADVSLIATVADDSHNHIIANVDGLQTALDTKLPSASYTAADVLTKLKTVDGTASGLDADLLDGKDGAFYLDASNINAGTIGDAYLPATISSDITGNAATATKLATARNITLTGDVTGTATFDGTLDASIAVTVADDSHNHVITNVDGLQVALDSKLNAASYTAADVLAKLQTVDGTLSGVDADLLDGQHGAYYLDWANVTNKPDPVVTVTLTGDVTGSASATLTDLASGTVSVTSTVVDNSHNHTSLTGVTSIGFAAEASDAASISTTISGVNTFFDFNLTDDYSQTDTWRWRFTPSGGTVFSAMELDVTSLTQAALLVQGVVNAAQFNSSIATGTAPLTVASTTLVTNLNADKLDGQDGAYYLDWTNATNKPDPVVTVTLNGDVSGTGSVTLTDLASGTVTVTTTVADDSHAHTIYQPIDADLTSIAGLTGTSGLLKKTAANTWALDTNSYIVANQTITFSGDATGSGNTAVTLTLANSGATAGTYGSATMIPAVTVDAKGRVTAISAVAPQAASTTVAGVTQLSTSTSSTSTSMAATPSAVKAAYDLAALAIPAAQRGVANGVATLDASGLIPSSQLPSFVDDVLEYASFASLPVTGETSKIYVTLDTNKIYRWSGTVYVEVSPVVGNSDSATKLATARTIALSGDVTGSATFDGTANITIAATVADDSHNHVIANVDGLQTALDAKLASASYTAADVLTKIKTVDGSSSGLDADLLDGKHGSDYLNLNTAVGGGIFGAPSKSAVGIFPSSSQGMVGFEYNMLHGALERYTVTQSGSAQISLGALFDGQLLPAYSGDGIDPANPWVLLLENLPSVHTQTGGVFGWTSRYWNPSSYKIEGYDVTSTPVWRTWIDTQASPVDSRDLILSLNNMGLAGNYTKIKITIYAAANGELGANGFKKFGLSEIFFHNPEAMRVYQYLDVDKLDGQHGSYYLNASNINAGTIGDAYLPASISSDITGNAATATKLATARTLSLSGDVTGSVTFDGTANATITAVVVDDSHNHTVSTVTGLQTTLTNLQAGIDTKLASTSYTAADVLTKLKTVDGSTSGLDADLLDGQEGSYYATATHNHTYDVNNAWLREAGDNGHFKQFGNTRQMAFRTDGTTEYSAGVGAYPFVWMYGGDSASNRKMSLSAAGDLTISGSLYAASKSFLINHPTKDGMKLCYGSLEGPENGVYVRGKLSNSNVIELPYYWSAMIDTSTITVTLTAFGKPQKLVVESIDGNKVIVKNKNLFNKQVNCFYTVFAERNDIAKLQVEKPQ